MTTEKKASAEPLDRCASCGQTFKRGEFWTMAHAATCSEPRPDR
jgi:hypothetical protein